MAHLSATRVGLTFTFGDPKTGKPFYIQGPNDSPEFAQHVMASLQRHCGIGNFDYLLEIG